MCIDLTHGTNAYKFKLVTLMVPDDFAAGTYTLYTGTCRVYVAPTEVNSIIHIYNNINTLGQPVGWCITDREDYDVIKLFLEKIKLQSPESQVSVIMTDDGMLMHTQSN